MELLVENQFTKIPPTIIAGAQRRKRLLEKAAEAEIQVEDTKINMRRAKTRLVDLFAAEPTYANLLALREAVSSYQTAASLFIAALYTMELAASAAGNFGASFKDAIVESGAKISPSLDQLKQDLKKAETNYQQIAAKQREDLVQNNLHVARDSEFRLIEKYAEREILYTIAKSVDSTAADGRNLVESVYAARQLRKDAHVWWRDERLAELAASGYSDSAARDIVARELRQKRKMEDKTGERAACICAEKKCLRLGQGLMRGDVQTGRANLPIAIAQHHDGKTIKKSARAERDVARRNKDIDAMAESVGNYVRGSVRMTLGILNELTSELMSEGYTRTDARKMAAEKFRAVHERRKNGNDRDANEWRERWMEYRRDLEFVRESRSLADTARALFSGSFPRTIRHDPNNRSQAPPAHRKLGDGARNLALDRIQRIH